jgi:bifunctional DNase/RNase
VELIKVEIQRVIGPTPSGAAVLLGNHAKTFVVFVGYYEAAALLRELNGEKPARPLTHELLQNVFLGFDVVIKRIVISAIIESTFCATLVLQQQIRDESGEWVGRRNEVRIDARPSDCLVLALKNKVDIFVAEDVFSQVQDVSKMTAEVESNLAGGTAADVDFEIRPEVSGAGEPTAEDDRFEDPDEDLFGADEDEEDDDEDEDEEDVDVEDEDEDEDDRKDRGGYK